MCVYCIIVPGVLYKIVDCIECLMSRLSRTANHILSCIQSIFIYTSARAIYFLMEMNQSKRYQNARPII